MTIYVNWKGAQGRETVDQVEVDGVHVMSASEARKEARRLVQEYNIAGMFGVYTSTRPCANWREA